MLNIEKKEMSIDELQKEKARVSTELAEVDSELKKKQVDMNMRKLISSWWYMPFVIVSFPVWGPILLVIWLMTGADDRTYWGRFCGGAASITLFIGFIVFIQLVLIYFGFSLKGSFGMSVWPTMFSLWLLMLVCVAIYAIWPFEK
jgi:magnesium-transporting ATPase (P-type)